MPTTRIRLRRYALVNQAGDLWEGLLKEHPWEVYAAYGSRSAALRDGWTAKSVAIYYAVKPPAVSQQKA